MAKEWTPTDIFELLADKHVRAILLATNRRKRSVRDLTNELDASQSSLYRRVDLMVDHGLLTEQTKVDDEGHHYTVYQPNFQAIDIQLDDDTLITRVKAPDEDTTQYVERWRR